jgi:hypothetical protein
MKNLSSTWFLEFPIDSEHKQYVLLDFLQAINKEIREDNIYHPIRKVFDLIRALKLVELAMNGQKLPAGELKDKEKKMIENFRTLKLSGDDYFELQETIRLSLDCLYRYAEIGSNIWKKIESRISVYNLNPKQENPNSGILLVRNMITDEVHPFWWSKYTNLSSVGVMMKNVKMKNNFYSISYDYLINEILTELKIESKSIKITVMEIYEDFDLNSNILKIAKDLFIEDLEIQLELL